MKWKYSIFILLIIGLLSCGEDEDPSSGKRVVSLRPSPLRTVLESRPLTRLKQITNFY